MGNELEAQVVCEFPRGSEQGRVTVDLVEKKVHFQNCHTPEKPLATAEAEFSCELADVLDVHEYTYPGSETLTIVTSSGTAVVPRLATHYAQLKELLGSVANITPAGRAVNNPAMHWVYALGALLGLMPPLLWVLNNPLMPFHLGVLALIATFTAICGAVLIRIVVVIFDRIFHLNITLSLSLGTMCMTIGMGCSNSLARNAWISWSGSMWLVVPGIAFLVGFLLGIPAMRKSARNR